MASSHFESAPASGCFVLTSAKSVVDVSRSALLYMRQMRNSYWVKDRDLITGPFTGRHILRMWFRGRIGLMAKARRIDLRQWEAVADLADRLSLRQRRGARTARARHKRRPAVEAHKARMAAGMLAPH